jgi:hypothetical protein
VPKITAGGGSPFAIAQVLVSTCSSTVCGSCPADLSWSVSYLSLSTLRT